MHEILNEYDRKIAEIDRRTRVAITRSFIFLAIYLAIVIYFGWFY